MWLENELLPKDWIFLIKFRLMSVTLILQSWRVTSGQFGIFNLWLWVSNMCTIFFPNPYSQVMHNGHLVLRGIKTPPNLSIICERYWLLTFEQLVGPHLKRSNSKPTKNPTSLEYEFFICCFDPYISGHHPTSVDTFYPRRLPPGGSQTPSKF